MATWPETATAVAVRFGDDGEIVICAPLGLTDLLAGTWRRNPARVGLETSRKRLQRQQPALRWPDVRVVPPEGWPSSIQVRLDDEPAVRSADPGPGALPAGGCVDHAGAAGGIPVDAARVRTDVDGPPCEVSR